MDGCEYAVGENGLVTDMDEMHAETLLQHTSAWALVNPEDFTRVRDQGDGRGKQLGHPEEMTHVVLPVGTEMDIPAKLPASEIRVPKRRGRPRKVDPA